MAILRKIKMGSISKRRRKKSYRPKQYTRGSFYEIKVVDSLLNRPVGQVVQIILGGY